MSEWPLECIKKFSQIRHNANYGMLLRWDCSSLSLTNIYRSWDDRCAKEPRIGHGAMIEILVTAS